MKINFKETIEKIPQHIREEVLAMENDDLDEVLEYLEGDISEAEICQSLNFFDLSYDYNTHEMTVPNNFNVDQAGDIIGCYLSIVDEDGQEYIDKHYDEVAQKLARKYDIHTEPHRGADDGTFDYAGSYMLVILDVIKAGICQS